MNSLKQPWYRFFKAIYNESDPYFFNHQELGWIEVIESNYEIIRQEMMEIIEKRNSELKPYRFHESSKAEWQTVAFFSWGLKFRRKSGWCPNTIAILKTIPGVVSASLSLLESESAIPTHRGDTNAIVRSHLGIVVPAPLPECGFQCGDEKRSWEHGRVLPFCDAQLHSAWNQTKERRYVLILDVIRPEYASLKNQVCATIIATHILLAIDQKIGFYDKASGRTLRIIAQPLIMLLRLFLPLQ